MIRYAKTNRTIETFTTDTVNEAIVIAKSENEVIEIVEPGFSGESCSEGVKNTVIPECCLCGSAENLGYQMSPGKYYCDDCAELIQLDLELLSFQLCFIPSINQLKLAGGANRL